MQDLYQLYLPIAGASINILLLLGIGIGVGLLAGMFGIGGGMLFVPILIFIGIPTQVAIITATNQMTAASFSSYLAYAKRSKVDYKLSLCMLCGSIIGVYLGLIAFSALSQVGQADLFISISIVIILSIIGFILAKEAAIIIYYKYKKMSLPQSNLPAVVARFALCRISFTSTQHPISLLLPIMVGMLGGFLLSFTGIGGSLVLIPILLHLLGTAPSYTVGTIQFQMVFTSILTTVLHSLTSQSLDIVLSMALIIGTVFGTQVGAKIGTKFNQETFKILLGTIVLTLCVRVAMSLFMTPKNLYYIEFLRP